MAAASVSGVAADKKLTQDGNVESFVKHASNGHSLQMLDSSSSEQQKAGAVLDMKCSLSDTEPLQQKQEDFPQDVIETLLLNHKPGENAGMTVRINKVNCNETNIQNVFVSGITPGGAADLAVGGSKGISIGDEILAINGVLINQLNYIECIALFKKMPLNAPLSIKRITQASLPDHSVTAMEKSIFCTPVSFNDNCILENFRLVEFTITRQFSENLGLCIAPSYGDTKEYYQVKQLLENGACFKSKLFIVGDLLVSYNQQKLYGIPHNHCLNILRSGGPELTFQVLRKKVGETTPPGKLVPVLDTGKNIKERDEILLLKEDHAATHEIYLLSEAKLDGEVKIFSPFYNLDKNQTHSNKGTSQIVLPDTVEYDLKFSASDTHADDLKQKTTFSQLKDANVFPQSDFSEILDKSQSESTEKFCLVNPVFQMDKGITDTVFDFQNAQGLTNCRKNKDESASISSVDGLLGLNATPLLLDTALTPNVVKQSPHLSAVASRENDQTQNLLDLQFENNHEMSKTNSNSQRFPAELGNSQPNLTSFKKSPKEDNLLLFSHESQILTPSKVSKINNQDVNWDLCYPNKSGEIRGQCQEGEFIEEGQISPLSYDDSLSESIGIQIPDDEVMSDIPFSLSSVNGILEFQAASTDSGCPESLATDVSKLCVHEDKQRRKELVSKCVEKSETVYMNYLETESPAEIEKSVFLETSKGTTDVEDDNSALKSQKEMAKHLEWETKREPSNPVFKPRTSYNSSEEQNDGLSPIDEPIKLRSAKLSSFSDTAPKIIPKSFSLVQKRNSSGSTYNIFGKTENLPRPISGVLQHSSTAGATKSETFTVRSENKPFQVEVLRGILGLGMVLKVNEKGHVQVMEIQKNSPIGRNGSIRIGDKILAINETELTGLSDSRIQQILTLLPRGLIKVVASALPPLPSTVVEQTRKSTDAERKPKMTFNSPIKLPAFTSKESEMEATKTLAFNRDVASGVSKGVHEAKGRVSTTRSPNTNTMLNINRLEVTSQHSQPASAKQSNRGTMHATHARPSLENAKLFQDKTISNKHCQEFKKTHKGTDSSIVVGTLFKPAEHMPQNSLKENIPDQCINDSTSELKFLSISNKIPKQIHLAESEKVSKKISKAPESIYALPTDDVNSKKYKNLVNYCNGSLQKDITVSDNKIVHSTSPNNESYTKQCFLSDFVAPQRVQNVNAARKNEYMKKDGQVEELIIQKRAKKDKAELGIVSSSSQSHITSDVIAPQRVQNVHTARTNEYMKKDEQVEELIIPKKAKKDKAELPSSQSNVTSDVIAPQRVQNVHTARTNEYMKKDEQVEELIIPKKAKKDKAELPSSQSHVTSDVIAPQRVQNVHTARTNEYMKKDEQVEELIIPKKAKKDKAELPSSQSHVTSDVIAPQRVQNVHTARTNEYMKKDEQVEELIIPKKAKKDKAELPSSQSHVTSDVIAPQRVQNVNTARTNEYMKKDEQVEELIIPKKAKKDKAELPSSQSHVTSDVIAPQRVQNVNTARTNEYMKKDEQVEELIIPKKAKKDKAELPSSQSHVASDVIAPQRVQNVNTARTNEYMKKDEQVEELIIPKRAKKDKVELDSRLRTDTGVVPHTMHSTSTSRINEYVNVDKQLEKIPSTKKRERDKCQLDTGSASTPSYISDITASQKPEYANTAKNNKYISTGYQVIKENIIPKKPETDLVTWSLQKHKALSCISIKKEQEIENKIQKVTIIKKTIKSPKPLVETRNFVFHEDVATQDESMKTKLSITNDVSNKDAEEGYLGPEIKPPLMPLPSKFDHHLNSSGTSPSSKLASKREGPIFKALPSVVMAPQTSDTGMKLITDNNAIASKKKSTKLAILDDQKVYKLRQLNNALSPIRKNNPQLLNEPHPYATHSSGSPDEVHLAEELYTAVLRPSSPSPRLPRSHLAASPDKQISIGEFMAFHSGLPATKSPKQSRRENIVDKTVFPFTQNPDGAKKVQHCHKEEDFGTNVQTKDSPQTSMRSLSSMAQEIPSDGCRVPVSISEYEGFPRGHHTQSQQISGETKNVMAPDLSLPTIITKWSDPQNQVEMTEDGGKEQGSATIPSEHWCKTFKQNQTLVSLTRAEQETAPLDSTELVKLVIQANSTLEKLGFVDQEIHVVVIIKGTTEKIGLHLKKGDNQELVVCSLDADGEASRCGYIQVGDSLLSVNGRSTRNKTVMDVKVWLQTVETKVVLILFRSQPEQQQEKPSEGKTFEVILHKGVTGVGFCLEGGAGSPLGDRPIIIKRIFKGGPAEKCAQLKVGDEILEVSGMKFTNQRHFVAWNHLKYLPEGQDIKMVIHRH